MKPDVRYRFLEFRYISPSVIYGQAIYLFVLSHAHIINL